MQTKNIASVPETKRRQMLAVKVSITCSTIIFIVAAWVGIAVDSITLILDASSSLVILAVAFLMKFSLNKIHRPADEMYNFGYGKYEPLTAFIQGILIISTCVFSIKFAVQDIVHPEDISNHLLPVAATFLSGIFGIAVWLYLKRLSRGTGSNMLRAAVLHWYADTVLSFGICLGFILGAFLNHAGYHKVTPYVDPVMAIILALILIRSSLKMVTHNVVELLDAVPAEDVHSRIKKAVHAHTHESLGVHRIRIRKAGEKIFLDVVFTGKDSLTLAETERLANKLEKDIISDLGNCDVVVSFKPHRTVTSPV